MTDPQPIDPMLEWYQHLYGEVEDGWLSFFSVDRTDGTPKVEWCRVTELDQAVEITRRLNLRGDVWNGVAVRTHRTAGRGGADECGWITALWADIDFKDEGHKGNDRLPPDVNAAVDIVRNFPLLPTAMTHTGGGLQAWYMLDEVTPVAELGDLLEAFGATWAKVGADLGHHVDNVFDLARVMRPAGSFNRKLDVARPVTLNGADWSRRYGVSEIRDACIDPPVVAVDHKRCDVPYIGPDRPGDEYNARHDGHELLTARGFHTPRTERDGVSYRAPHRDAKGHNGAVVYADDGHTTIYSETFAAQAGLDVRRPYDPYGLFVALEHGGDFAEASRTLRAAGYGTSANNADPFGRPPLGVDPTTEEIADGDAPIPLDRFDLPPFPLDVLPAWLRTEVVATAKSVQAPVEIAAGVALVALSTACAGKVDVDGINWRQPVNLYVSIVAASGIGKSPVASRLLGPLYDLEEALGNEAHQQIAEAVAEQAAIDEQISAAKGLLKKDPESRYAKDAMRDAELARLDHDVPATPRLIADDHTPEALSELIARQAASRIAILSPEGATLFSTMTGARYKSGGDAPPEVPPVYLKAWGGEPMPIDRKGSGSITVKRPILTVGVLVQPFVVDRLAMTPQIAAQGALARFLWIVAEDNVGRRNRRERRNTAPVSNEYTERITALARRCLSWHMPGCMTATVEAADLLDDINDERERRMGLGGDLDAYREIEAKIVGYQWRLAALLAMAHGDDMSTGITVERARQAAELAGYFLEHSIAVHRRAGLDERGGTIRACAAYMIRHAGEVVDWRDFQLAMRSVYDATADAQMDLAELVRMRWLTVEAGDISAIGVQRTPNPVVNVDARLRALNHGEDGGK